MKQQLGMENNILKDNVQLATNEELTAEATFKNKISKNQIILIASFVLLVALISLFLGRYSSDPSEILNSIITGGEKTFKYLLACINDPTLISEGTIPYTDIERVIYRIRMPRILIVMLVGAALAVSGASYQGMFKNPLTSQDLLGASAGASLGACLAMLWNLDGVGIQIGAFIGGLIAVGCAVWLNKLVDYDPILGLVLAGILVSTLFQSGMSVVKLLADTDDKLPQITFWLMGSFADVLTKDLVIIIPMTLGFIILMSQSWKLNVLSFGDEEARSLGINTKRTRLLVIIGSTILASSSVAVAGIIGWIGLVVPHLARALVGPNYKTLLPTSIFIGSAFLLIVDDIARLALTIEIPIGILTSFLGVPFFVFIFKKNMRGWN